MKKSNIQNAKGSGRWLRRLVRPHGDLHKRLSEPPKSSDHKKSSGQREKSPIPRQRTYSENSHARKSSGRKRALARIAHIANAGLLRPDRAIHFLRPIFCKRRLKQPVLVALGQEVALLDWDQRYTIYASPAGLEIVGVGRQDGSMLRQLVSDSYKRVVWPNESKLSHGGGES